MDKIEKFRVILFLLILYGSISWADSSIGPDVTIISPVDSTATNKDTIDVEVRFMASANPTGKANVPTGNVKTVVLKIDGQEVTRYENPAENEEGSHIFQIDISSYPDSVVILQSFAYQGNENANLMGESSKVSLIIDRTPPVVTAALNLPPNNFGWNRSDITVSFTATDNLSGVEWVSPDTLVIEEGKDQQVKGEALDKAGNLGSITVSVSLDKTHPDITSLEPLEGTETDNTQVPIEATYTDLLSGINVESVRLILDNNNVSENTTISESNLRYAPPSPLEDGTHIARIEVEDKAGNTVSRSTSFVVRTGPAIPLPPIDLTNAIVIGGIAVDGKVTGLGGKVIVSYNGVVTNQDNITTHLPLEGAVSVEVHSDDPLLAIIVELGSISIRVLGLSPGVYELKVSIRYNTGIVERSKLTIYHVGTLFDAQDALQDPDGDELPNIAEFLLGTEPFQSDTDGDSLPDGWEVQNNIDPLLGQGDEGPDGDPDVDGLQNWAELDLKTQPKDAGSRVIESLIDVRGRSLSENPTVWNLSFRFWKGCGWIDGGFVKTASPPVIPEDFGIPQEGAVLEGFGICISNCPVRTRFNATLSSYPAVGIIGGLTSFAVSVVGQWHRQFIRDLNTGIFFPEFSVGTPFPSTLGDIFMSFRMAPRAIDLDLFVEGGIADSNTQEGTTLFCQPGLKPDGSKERRKATAKLSGRLVESGIKHFITFQSTEPGSLTFARDTVFPTGTQIEFYGSPAYAVVVRTEQEATVELIQGDDPNAPSGNLISHVNTIGDENGDDAPDTRRPIVGGSLETVPGITYEDVHPPFHPNQPVPTPFIGAVGTSEEASAVKVGLGFQGLAEDAEGQAPPHETDPGAFMCVNDNDNDGRSGIDKDETNLPLGQDDPDLQPINLSINPNPRTGTISLSVPSSVKVWKDRKKNTTQISWNLQNEIMPQTLYIEGFSASSGDITLSYAGTTPTCEDKVKVTVVEVEFSPSELRICTDGIPGTTYNGEFKDVTATITPSTISIFFESSNINIVTVSPTSGTGIVRLTVTAKGVGTAEIQARPGSTTVPICKTLSVTTQKPSGLVLVGIQDLSCTPQIGDKELRTMNVIDTNGEIIDIMGCFLSETFPELICSDQTGGRGLPGPKSIVSPDPQIFDLISFCSDPDPTPPTFEEVFCYSFTQIISVLDVPLTPAFIHNFERIDGETIELNTMPF